MSARDDFESYLIRLGVEHDEVDDGMWLLETPEGDAPVVAHHSPPVLLLRLKVMDLPDGVQDAQFSALYRRLLELNAADIVHGSYGIEGDDIVLSEALELATLDFHEFQTAYESMVFAASSHLRELAKLVPVAHED